MLWAVITKVAPAKLFENSLSWKSWILYRDSLGYKTDQDPTIGSTTLCLSTRWRSSCTSRPPRQRHFWEKLALIVNLWNENLNIGATCISSLRTNNPSFSEYFLPLSTSRNHMNTTSWTKKETFKEYFLMTRHSPTIWERFKDFRPVKYSRTVGLLERRTHERFPSCIPSNTRALLLLF